MAKSEGESLKNELKGTGRKMDEIAKLLGMSRQNLNYHLRKEILEDDFKRLLAEKRSSIFHMENRMDENDVQSRLLRIEANLEVFQISIAGLKSKKIEDFDQRFSELQTLIEAAVKRRIEKQA